MDHRLFDMGDRCDLHRCLHLTMDFHRSAFHDDCVLLHHELLPSYLLTVDPVVIHHSEPYHDSFL